VKPRVLVTGAGGRAGAAIAGQLKARGIPVLGTDIRELPPGSGITVVRVPEASDPELVSALRRLVAAEGVNLVIPTVREELPQLAAFRAGFGPDVRVIVGEPGPVAIANDKLFTAWKLQSAGVPVPRFGVPRDFSNARAAMDALGGPVLLQPRAARCGHGAMLIDGSEAVDWHRLPEGLIVQEFILGAEYGSMVFGTPAHHAAPPVVVVEKTELAPGCRGNAVITRRVGTEEARDVGNAALAAVRVLELTGPVDVGVRRRPDGTPVVLSVDARFGPDSASAPELLEAVLASFVLPAFNPASFRQSTDAYANVAVV